MSDLKKKKRRGEKAIPFFLRTTWNVEGRMGGKHLSRQKTLPVFHLLGWVVDL